MPPWKPVAGFGEFLDVRRLADADVARVREWVAAGAPEGDPKDAAAAPKMARDVDARLSRRGAGAGRGLRGSVARTATSTAAS